MSEGPTTPARASTPPMVPSVASLRILILDDEATIRVTLRLCLEAAGHRVADFATGPEAMTASAANVYDLLFLDLRLGTQNGLDLIPEFMAQSPWMKIVVITAYASIDTAVEAMRRGALDYLPKPFIPEHVEMLAAKVAQTRAMEYRLRELLNHKDASAPPVLLTSDDPQTQAAFELARTFAPSKAAILIQAESGAGKRTLARAIHDWSPRRDVPFAVCTTHVPDEKSLGRELFGSGRADDPNRCRLEHCAGGTLYLDDLCALPPRLQLKLLEFMQNGAFEREESFDSVSADVRIIAGANQLPGPLTEASLLRPELFYIFSAKSIEIPPLRQRMADFANLVESYAAFYSRQKSKSFANFKPEALDYLRHYAWPGNLRELRNVIERAVLLARPAAVGGQEIGIAHLPPNLRTRDSAARLGDLVPLEAIEELHIRGVLASTQSLETAAKVLGIDYATLWRRRKKYGL